MHFTTFLATALSALSLASAQAPQPIPGTTGKLGDAQISTNNPIGVTYQAVLPDSNTTGIRGYIAGTTNSNGTGIYFNINFYGFPDQSLGPFSTYTYLDFLSTAKMAQWQRMANFILSLPHPRSTGSLRRQLHWHPRTSRPHHSRRGPPL